MRFRNSRRTVFSLRDSQIDQLMNTNQYLDRIRFRGSLLPTKELLFDLQLAHLLAVPFENLSIYANEPILLQEDWLFDKIVLRRRGGFCYELNGLFACLLRQLGFTVTMLSARVAGADRVLGPEFDHMTLMVCLDTRWLVDVGFGDSFRQPLLVDSRDECKQGERLYQIVQDNESLVLRECEQGGEWKDQYHFTLEPHVLADYEEMCRYHQTSPDSSFTKRRVCSIARRDGRVTLSDMRRIETAGGERRESFLTNQQEYAGVLEREFGIII